MRGSLPTASTGVQFRKAQQVYQNLCCPFVALSFQKPDLVPDLILPGGGGCVGPRPAPSSLNIWWTSAAFGWSVINIVKELPVLRRGSPAFTGTGETYCLCVKSFKSSLAMF